MSDTLYGFIALGVIGVLILIIALLFCLACYALVSYPLYKTLTAAGYEAAWLAWIPFCRYYAITMAFNYKNESYITVLGLSVPRPLAGFALLIGTVLGNMIPFIGGIFPIMAIIIDGFILGEMFDVCENSQPGKNTAMGIISALIVFVQIFMFFKYMGKANRGEIDLNSYQATH